MPHPGTQLGVWILVCLVLAAIWVITILVIRRLMGGGGSADAEIASAGAGHEERKEAEPIPRLLDDTCTSPEPDPYRRRR